MVFLPVALTWLAISKAASAFTLYGATNALNLINFLDFWQNGYGVLSQNWSLSHIATMDFLIIMLVIALTISSTVLAQIEESKFGQAERDFLGSRVVINLAISVHAHRNALKNLRSLRSRLALELSLRDNRKTLKNLKSYAD